MGIETSDDAAVYKLSDDMAMINTVDFITPPVEDPYWFGQISAANSISDVYSMGGKPLTALNVVMFPSGHIDLGVLRDILRGGYDKVVEAGACLVGGHTVDDNEPKYGLCVNGIVHPDKILTNAGAQVGDALVLTKPLGSGVLFNAARAGKFPYASLERDVLPTLAMLNKIAIEKAVAYDVHACTDITGFGILGHSLEMSIGAGHHIILQYDQLPFYDGALDMYKIGQTTGSNKANRTMVERHPLRYECNLTAKEAELLYDPQTSGGLLFSLPKEQAKQLVVDLERANAAASAIIGEVTDADIGLTVIRS